MARVLVLSTCTLFLALSLLIGSGDAKLLRGPREPRSTRKDEMASRRKMFRPRHHLQHVSKSHVAASKPHKRTSPKITLSYHGGAVLGIPRALNIYLIYYGNWNYSNGGATYQYLIENFIRSLSSDSGKQAPTGAASVKGWYATMGEFYDRTGAKASKQVRLAGKAYDSYSQGQTWADDSNSMWAVIVRQIKLKKLPVDSNAIYLVLTSKDVKVSGACNDYCGWHSQNNYEDGTPLPIALVMDAGQCVDGCGFRKSAAAGKTGAMDGTVSVIGHEIAEAVSNPAGDGWYSDSPGIDSSQAENGDLCDSVFGTVLKSSGGTYEYNMIGLNGVPYMVQATFSRVSNACKVQGQL